MLAESFSGQYNSAEMFPFEKSYDRYFHWNAMHPQGAEPNPWLPQ